MTRKDAAVVAGGRCRSWAFRGARRGGGTRRGNCRADCRFGAGFCGFIEIIFIFILFIELGKGALLVETARGARASFCHFQWKQEANRKLK